MYTNKKIISLISAASAVVLLSSGIISSLAISSQPVVNDNDPEIDITKPLNRGDNYHQYSISQQMLSNNKMEEVVELVYESDKYYYAFSETKFLDKIEIIVREAIASIPKFKSSVNDYTIEINYKIFDSKTRIDFDVVWYLPNDKFQTYYYDQFEICLNK